MMIFMAVLIPSENVACIDLVFYVGEAFVEAVGDDAGGLLLEGFKVVDYLAAKECRAVFECWLVDDYLGALRLDALHDSLDG